MVWAHGEEQGGLLDLPSKSAQWVQYYCTGKNIWNHHKSGDFCENNTRVKKTTMRNHDWPNFPRDMWCIDRCSEAFLWGYHSFPLLLCEVFGVIRGCKMFPRICYPIFRGYHFVSPGWMKICVRGKVGKMSFRQNDCTGKKTFWKASKEVIVSMRFSNKKLQNLTF